MIRQPMLAAKVEDITSLKFPLLVSPKLDGVRAMVIGGVVYSRKMKPIPNDYVQERFGRPEYEHLDGELIVGDPRHPDAFRRTTSAVMTHTGPSDVRFYVFDRFHPSATFLERIRAAEDACDNFHSVFVEHEYVVTGAHLLDTEELYLREGYEGVMVRHPTGLYKQGRSTAREGWLMKLKRFHDSEAEVLAAVELMHNDNEAKPDERGYMKRSSHQDNKRPAGKLGALTVRDVTSGTVFEIGTGFTDGDRQTLWAVRDTLPGRFVKYRYFPTGSKEKPRFPTFVGFRAAQDL